MPRGARLLAGAALLAVSVIAAPARPASPVAMAAPVYPETRRDPLVETRFGERVGDPYRWLEADVRGDAEVARWVERQNAATRTYLDTLPQREWFAARIRELLDHERFGLPVKAGGHYFYTRNTGLLNQPQLFVRKGLSGRPRLLLDPNVWARDGATALDEWKPSDDGRFLLYSVQDGGSDWRTLRVYDVAATRVLRDEVHWAKYTELAWVGSEGFLYTRFPEPAADGAFQDPNYNQSIWYHRIGTPQSRDELVFATPDHPERRHTAEVTDDGRLAVITSSIGTDARYEVHTIDLERRDGVGWQAEPLVTGFDHDWKLVDGVGRTLWFVTNQDAPRYRLVAINLAVKQPRWHELVPQGEDTLQRGTIIGQQLILSYLHNAATRALIYDLRGRSIRTLSLRDIGTASGFRGKAGDPETFYSFSSFNRPQGIYRMDLASGESKPFAEPDIAFDPDDYDVDQRFFTSKDGTRVPMFVVRGKDAARKNRPLPTLLYGYGGFDVSLTPAFSAVRMAWLEAGGAFVMANLRGGGEFGREWHESGRLENKQNVFDDFIAAGEYLIREGITPPGGLAIQGGSNGGLLVGAVVNQRPDLFAAAVPQVGVMDMLRFHKFTAGRYWTDDYGDPEVEADWRRLRGYSPYHNIRAGQDYPAILVTTADTDDRVVPGHSFKYAAELQAADLGGKPRLIRIDARAGHGTGKPTEKAIAEGADILAFVAQWTGLRPPPLAIRMANDVHNNSDKAE